MGRVGIAVIGVAVVLSAGGCMTYCRDDVSGWDQWELEQAEDQERREAAWNETEAQLKKDRELQDRYERMLERDGKLQAREEALQDRLEKQADRMDALLDKWEAGDQESGVRGQQSER